MRFDEKYPRKAGLSWQGWQIHRWLLAELDKTSWAQIASDLHDRLTDEVIEEAVRQIPRPYYEKGGSEITRKLKARRDRLPEYARQMYKFQASEVDVKATNQDERIELRELDNGSLEVIVTPTSDPANIYYRRSFHSRETRSVRVYLGEGTDTVICSGSVSRSIKIEVIGNTSIDRLSECGDMLRFTGIEEMEQRQIPIRERPTPSQYFLKKEEKPAWVRRRDWGSRIVPIYQVGLSSDRGLLLGGGVSIDRYQFGKVPYGHRHTLTGAYSSALSTGRLVYKGSYQFWNPRVLGSLSTFVSGLQQARFYGFGNETTDDADGDFYKSELTTYLFEPSIKYVVANQLGAFINAQFKSTSTDDSAVANYRLNLPT